MKTVNIKLKIKYIVFVKTRKYQNALSVNSIRFCNASFYLELPCIVLYCIVGIVLYCTKTGKLQLRRHVDATLAPQWTIP